MYTAVMKFFHTSASQLAEDADMREMLKVAREIYAHSIRLHQYTMFVTHLPHRVDPAVYGSVEDCDLCSQIPLTEIAEAMIADMQQNGGYFYSPSDSDVPNHYKTFLEERARALAGQRGAEPDAAFELERAETKYPGCLYPKHAKCPHPGCYLFRFRCAAEAHAHENRFHPDWRKQRFVDEKRERAKKPPLPRTHGCSNCPASFSSLSILDCHRKSYGHESQSALTKRANKAAREGKSKLPAQPQGKLKLKHTLLPLPPLLGPFAMMKNGAMMKRAMKTK